VKILESKRNKFYELAKKYNIFLLNRLPDKTNYRYDINIEKELVVRKENDVEIKDKRNNDIKMEKNNFELKDNSIELEKKDVELKEEEKNYKFKLFCIEPFKRMTIDNRQQAVPSCLCQAIKNFKYIKLKKHSNSILIDWNGMAFQNYRKYIILNKQEDICLNDCIENKFINNSKGE